MEEVEKGGRIVKAIAKVFSKNIQIERKKVRQCDYEKYKDTKPDRKGGSSAV